MASQRAVELTASSDNGCGEPSLPSRRSVCTQPRPIAVAGLSEKRSFDPISPSRRHVSDDISDFPRLDAPRNQAACPLRGTATSREKESGFNETAMHDSCGRESRLALGRRISELGLVQLRRRCRRGVRPRASTQITAPRHGGPARAGAYDDEVASGGFDGGHGACTIWIRIALRPRCGCAQLELVAAVRRRAVIPVPSRCRWAPRGRPIPHPSNIITEAMKCPSLVVGVMSPSGRCARAGPAARRPAPPMRGAGLSARRAGRASPKPDQYEAQG